MKILVDTIYINSLGGKSLVSYFLSRINKIDLGNYFFLFDIRLDKEVYKKLNPNNYLILKNSEKQRKIFYKKNQTQFNTVFCFSNVPPPIKLSQNVFIYFHNELLISTKNSEFNIINKLIFKIKSLYIKQKNKKNYNWIVQTNLMKQKLKKFIAGNNILVYPFFDSLNNTSPVKVNSNTFFYPAGSSKHKNHKNLLEAFKIYLKQNHEKVELNFTLEEKFFKKLESDYSELFKIMRINNLGMISKKEMIINYKSNQFCIYPSLKESFGMPLIESCQLKRIILASDLPYVNELIIPSIKFNPFSPHDIASAINKAISEKNHNLPILKVKDTIDQLIKMLNEPI